MIRVELIGPMGYTGAEILRLLLFHPEVEITQLQAPVEKPTPIVDFLPNLRGLTDLVIQDVGAPIPKNLDCVLMAVPHGITQKLARRYLDAGARVIDLSADFRLRDPSLYPIWYKFEHQDPELLPRAVYGLTEVFRESIPEATLLANPGCYPTSVCLPLAPLAKADFVAFQTLICDCKTGVSGAGRNPKEAFHFRQRADNFSAYKVIGHQHIPEMEQVLGDLSGHPVRVRFTPHLIPARRGILSTLYLELTRDIPLKAIHELYRDYYRDACFVRLLDGEPLPSLNAVNGSNYCDIALYMDDRTGYLVVVSMLDNLLKGAAGQAVQNMNLMFGFPEETGLERPGLFV
jgi:N-acetyl-gamma-glutamyl-phosphate reductase